MQANTQFQDPYLSLIQKEKALQWNPWKASLVRTFSKWHQVEDDRAPDRFGSWVGIIYTWGAWHKKTVHGREQRERVQSDEQRKGRTEKDMGINGSASMPCGWWKVRTCHIPTELIASVLSVDWTMNLHLGLWVFYYEAVWTGSSFAVVTPPTWLTKDFQTVRLTVPRAGEHSPLSLSLLEAHSLPSHPSPLFLLLLLLLFSFTLTSHLSSVSSSVIVSCLGHCQPRSGLYLV